jgi:hypothetical protein
MSIRERANRSDETSSAILLYSRDGRIEVVTRLHLNEGQCNANALRSGLQFAAGLGRRGLGAGKRGESGRSRQRLPQQFDEL